VAVLVPAQCLTIDQIRMTLINEQQIGNERATHSCSPNRRINRVISKCNSDG